LATVSVARHLVAPLPDFEADFASKVERGRDVFKESSVAFVGLARNCEQPLRGNLARLAALAAGCRDWRLYVEENDSTDGTVGVLADFAAANTKAFYRARRLGREQYGPEFAGRRTIALAEYRADCQRWVSSQFPQSDFVAIVDFDAWGGWSYDGIMNGIGWLDSTPDACGMASVSLFQYDFGSGPQWAHYDCWSLRLNTPWDDYTAGYGGWKYGWLPLIGSPPVRVCSAFGGMAIYRTSAYLAGQYDGATDCEHVPFHRSIHEATGQHLYLCPSMRMVMSWLEQSDNGGQHLND